MRNPGMIKAPGSRQDEHGSAMLEFVLMLPFIFIILILIFNFGEVFLERQRTFVAVREMAIRHGAQIGSEGNNRTDQLVERLTRDTLSQRTMSAEFTVTDGGTCPRRQEAVDEGQISDALNRDFGWIAGAMTSVLTFLSRTQVYEITAQGLPMPFFQRGARGQVVGRTLSAPTYSACFAIDNRPWTYSETGGPSDWVKGLFSKLGDIF